MTNDLKWYVARVKYHTEKKIKSFFENETIEHYIPFRETDQEQNGKRMQKELPVIPCLVFIRTNYRKALSLLQNSSFDISYIKHPETQKLHTIPDKQMQDFMLVLNFSTATFIMENSSLRRGERVRVTKGEFTGIEGELVRLKGHKRIVVRLEGLVSAVTTYVPGKYLEQIASTK